MLQSITTHSRRVLEEQPSKATFLELDPQCCKPWSYHNRDQACLSFEGCSDLIKSIQKHGQIEPVVVRAVQTGSGASFEIISGVRRWFACTQIKGQKLLARLTDADDRQCMLLMYADNADSQDISDMERAFSFAAQMKSGAFKSQTDLARALGISQSTISKLLKIVGLFEKSWFSALFDPKRDVPLQKAYRLSVLLKKPALSLKIEAEAERMLVQKKQGQCLGSAKMLLRQLIGCVRPDKGRKVIEERVLLSKDEKAVMIAKEDQSGHLVLKLDRGVRDYDPDRLAALCLQAIQGYCGKHESVS